MPITNYCIAEMLNNFFGQQQAITTPPASWYVGLSDHPLTPEIIDGTSCWEITGTNYDRLQISNDSGDNIYWLTATTTKPLILNAAPFSFSQAGDDWGTIYALFLADSTLGLGNVWWYENILPTMYISENDILSFGAKTLLITME